MSRAASVEFVDRMVNLVADETLATFETQAKRIAALEARADKAAKGGKATLTLSDIKSLPEGFAPVIRQYVTEHLDPLVARLEVVERRLAEAEANRLRFCWHVAIERQIQAR